MKRLVIHPLYCKICIYRIILIARVDNSVNGGLTMINNMDNPINNMDSSDENVNQPSAEM